MTGRTVERARVVDVAGVTQLVGFLREHGFPGVERRPRSRGREVGAVDGTPGLEWGVKRAAEPVDLRQLLMWVSAVDAHRWRMGADLGVLVVVGPEVKPAGWDSVLVAGAARARMPLGRLVELLVGMGYGGEPEPGEDGAPWPA